MITRFKEIISKLKTLKAGDNNQIGTDFEAAQSSVKAKNKQDLILWTALVTVLLIAVIWLKYKSSMSDTSREVKEEKETLKLEIASKSLDAEKMWRNHFEDKLTEITDQSKTKLELIENSINEQSNAYTNQLKMELDKLKAQLEYITEEQAISKKELLDSKLQAQQEREAQSSRHGHDSETSNFTINNLGRDEMFDRPKSSRNFIPETAYVSGILLDGLAVSTSMGSSAEPVPVVIRITSRGSLPKNFNIDLTTCKILGSSYGDLSSERAIIRAEVLSCTDPVNEVVYTTRIAGNVYGDDGMNGIKGKVVQTSSKHLKNAIAGGMISGFAGSAKSQGSFAITGAGAVSTGKQKFGDVLKDGGLEGASNAAERIADYYIKQAESMSPILIVSGGTKVDILFTKGVYFGALDVQEKLQQARGEKIKK